MKQSKGFSSLEFIVTLFFLSLIVIALGLFLRISDLSIRKHISKKEDIKAIDIILNLVFEEIKKDTTPSVDSLLDPVWKLNDTEIDGYKISIQALSGLIGLNFINKNLLTKTNLKEVFNSPEDVDSVIEVITQEGPINSYEKISEYISEENFNKYFTLYEYANFNIADEYGFFHGSRCDFYETVKNLSGYTETDRPNLDGLTATEEEKQMISEIMTGGFYV